MDDGIINRHPGQQKRTELQQGKDNIDKVQYFYAVPHLRHDLIHGGAGHLRPQDMHGPVGGLGGDNGDEYQDTHTADPMGEAAPELDRIR